MKKVRLTINGRAQQFIIDPKRILLDLLREDLKLTGAKQSCDRKGQCGACTVIVNGKAVRSCLTKVVELDGAEVITVEGLGTPQNPHLIQEAFVLSGAIQCGFCTPGMIMAAKALLDEKPNPSVEEIKTALRRILCRCTGYKKIIEAVQLAGRFLRKEITPDQVQTRPERPQNRRKPSATIGDAQGLRRGRVLSRHQGGRRGGIGRGPQPPRPCANQIHSYGRCRKNAGRDRSHDRQRY